MRFFGSAMRKPHTHGGFRDRMVVEEYQCEPMGDKVSLGEAASSIDLNPVMLGSSGAVVVDALLERAQH